jgi:anthranilate/para-aminobenzoate synthase component II
MDYHANCPKCGSDVLITFHVLHGKASCVNAKGTFTSFADPEHPAKILSIHEVSIKTCLTPDQIRYYARNGHIKPRRKGKCGHFQFHQKDVDILNKLVAKRHTKEG